VKADYTDGEKIIRNWAFLKKQFKEIFSAFLAQSGVSLGSIHPARFLELRPCEITVVPRETFQIVALQFESAVGVVSRARCNC